MSGTRLNWSARVMLAPTIIVLLVVGIYPLLFVLNMSVRTYLLSKPYLGHDFLGAKNYVTVLNDPLFWQSLRRTAQFFAYTIPLQLVVGIGIALLLDGTRWRKLSALTRVVLVLPIATTPTVVGLVGRLLFNRDFGFINYLLSVVGVEPVSWLGEAGPAMLTIALTDIWQWTPFFALVMLSGLATIPADVLEAVQLETRNNWNIFRFIQLPYLWPGITAVLIIRTADILKLFDMIFVLTRGGPGVSTELVSVYIQRVGFRVFDMGVASAQAVLLLILCIILSRLYIRLFHHEVEVL